MLPHPKGVCTDRQVHILYVITLIKKWVMTAWFQHSHFKIQAGLHMIGFLTKHPLKRICVPVWNRAFPKVNLFSPVLLALFLRIHFLLTPPGRKEVYTPRFTACFSSLQLLPFPCLMNGSPAPSKCQCSIKHDDTLKEFPGINCTKLIQSWM